MSSLHNSTLHIRWHLGLVIGLVCFLLLGTWAIISRVQRTDAEIRQYLLHQASEIAQNLDPSLIDSLTFSPLDNSSWAYQQLHSQLTTYGELLEQKAIYTLVVRRDVVVYGPRSNVNSSIDEPPGMQYLAASPVLWDVFSTVTPTTSNFHISEDVSVLSAYAPVVSPSTQRTVMVVGIDMTREEWWRVICQRTLPIVIGTVIIFGVILLGLLALWWRNRLPLEAQRRWIYLDAIFAAVLGLALTFAFSLLIMDAERSERRLIFRNLANNYAAQITNRFRDIEQNLHSLESFYRSHNEVNYNVVSRNEFMHFTQSLMTGTSRHAYGWVAVVPAGELEAYEATQQQNGASNFTVWEMDANGEPQAPTNRANYYPIEFIVSLIQQPSPIQMNLTGFDLGSDATYFEALRTAQRTGMVSGTAPIATLTNTEPTLSLMAFRPVYSSATSKDHVSGFVLSVVRVTDILTRLLRDEEGISNVATVGLLDLRARSEPYLLATYPAAYPQDQRVTRLMTNAENLPISYGLRGDEYVVTPLFALGRVYGIFTVADSSFYALYPLRTTGLVAVAGFFFSVVLSVVLAFLRSGNTLLREIVYEQSLAQKRSEARNRSIVQTIPDLILRFNRAGVVMETFTSSMDSAYGDTNYLVGGSYETLLPPLAAEKFQYAIQEVFRKPGLQQVEFSTPSADPQDNDDWYEARLVYTEGEDGWAWLRNITVRKEFELALKHQVDLKHTLMHLATGFVNVPLADFDQAINDALATAGRFVGADRAYLFRYDFKNGIVSNSNEWCADGIASRIEYMRMIPLDLTDEWIKNHRLGNMVVIHNMAELPKDGALYDLMKAQEIQSMLNCPLGRGERCIGFVGFENSIAPRVWTQDIIDLLTVLAEMLLNIEERRRYEENLVTARMDAESANLIKGQFLANMSHEIRTPMNGVIGITNLLLDTELLPEQRQYAETIQSSGEALMHIINDILDFSKIEANKLELENIDFDLRSIVEEVADLLVHTSLSQDVELIPHLAVNVPCKLRGDPSRLRQVLLNLAGNAMKFTAKGEVVIRIVLQELALDSVRLQFSVSDTGIGISPEKMNQLFTAFQQIDASNSRRYGGTGLGLAIAKRLVEMMDGHIAVESQDGKGSTFRFDVRLGLQSGAQVDLLPLAHIAGARVLVIDDSTEVRATLHEQLLYWSMRPSEIDHVSDALLHLRNAQLEGDLYRVLLVEWQEENQSSYNAEWLLRSLQEESMLQAQPLAVIWMIGHARSGHARQLVQALINRFAIPQTIICLNKPLRQAQLHAALVQSLGGEPMLDALLAANDAAWPPKNQRTNAVRISTSVARSAITEPSVTLPRDTAKARILLAEDNAVNQKLATRILEKMGLRVDTVANGQEAISALEIEKYDLVLMDVQMPVMDGFTATRIIRSGINPRVNTQVPIIAMTAYALKGDRERCLEAGMNDYMAKPIHPDIMQEKLQLWLSNLSLGDEDPTMRA